MIPYALLAAAAEAVAPATAESAETAAAAAQRRQSLLESHLNDADSVVRQLQEQGPGFFSNLWNNHSDDIIRFVKVVILALVVIVVAKLVSMAARKIIARLFKKIEGDESLTYATYTIVRTLIWVIGTLIILDLFGFNTASLLTVLGAAGLAIGLSLILIHLVGIHYTGTSVNPARSIGPALFEGGQALSDLWVFIVGPFAGAAIAAGIWKIIGEEK